MLSASLQPPADYIIGVRTRGERNSGTDANVFITVVGSTRSLNDVQLKDSMSHMDKFERGSVDWFLFSLPQTLGDVTRVALRSDNSGMFSSWSPESVVIFDKKCGHESIWSCDGSLNKDRPVAELQRVKPDSGSAAASNFLFSIRLGAASLPSNAVVSLTLNGTARSETIVLAESVLNRERFLRESTDAFFVSTKSGIGTLHSVTLEVATSSNGFQVCACMVACNRHLLKLFCPQMSVLEASLREFVSDTEWNFGGGRYLDATTPSIKLPSQSRRNLSSQAESLTFTKLAHGKMVEERSGLGQSGPVNTYCVANPSCAAVFNWRGTCASVVQVRMF
jgi:hypothetical protein